MCIRDSMDTEYPDVRELQARNGFRTVLAVPLIRDGRSIGAIALLRNQVRPFSTAEVLQVVSSSMANAQPVFEKIVECCERLFPAQAFALGIVEDDERLSLPV